MMCRTFVYLMCAILLFGLATSIASGLEVKINFQRSSDTIPEGYLADYGLVFGNRNNGYFYGWNTDITRLAHKRNSSSDQRYDTNVDMQDPQTSTDYTWEIELPVGIYDIFVVCGDAYYANHVSNIDVEGVILDDPDGPSNFDEYSVTVTVTDGRLTIKPAFGAVKTSLVFIHITRVETFKAYGPDPKDGAIYPDTYAVLSWTPGDEAVSHNVYFGDNYSNVNDGTGGTFQINQTDTSYYVSLNPDTTYYWRIDEVNASNPSSPCKGDIWSFKTAPKTAYNPVPTDGATMVELNVTLSWTAGIGAKFHNVYLGIDKNAVENATTTSPECMVKNYNLLIYQPGPPKITMERNKTYYWRIDEFDGSAWHQGDVWSFSTIPIIPITDPSLLCWWKFDDSLDTATTAFDSSGYDHHGAINGTNLVTNGRIGEARSFFGRTSDYVVDDDAEDYINGLSAITICTWIKSSVIGVDSGFIHCYFPHGSSDKTVTMRYDRVGLLGGGNNVFKVAVRIGSPTIDPGNFGDEQVSYESSANKQSTEWQHVTMTWHAGERIRFYIDGKEDLPTGYETPGPNDCVIVNSNILKVGACSYQPWDGLIDDVRIYNKVLTKEDIDRVMIGEADHAWNPRPVDGSTPDLHRALPLSWSAGSLAAQHDVYFGTDENAVADANTSDTTGIYRPRQTATSYAPLEGVEWGKGPYYWRIDEYNTNGTLTQGKVWQFTVADFILVDDIEDYNNTYPDRVFNAWLDGTGHSIFENGIDTGKDYCGNGTGSTVGYTEPPYAEIGIVNSGEQSIPFYYNNSATSYNICSQLITKYYSEAKRSLAYPRDWTEQDVKALTLWFRGYPAGFKEEPVKTYTMSALGRLLENDYDRLRFAYKRFTGAGSIEAKVLNIQFGLDENTRAGVMIRRTLDAGSAYAAVLITAEGHCRFDYRASPGNDVQNAGNEPNIFAPYWVKLERDSSDNFNGYHSSDGVNWQAFSSNPLYVDMPEEVYIGLVLKLNVKNEYSNALCKAQFSEVEINGSVSPPVNVWTDEVIGTEMQTNDPEPMYVAIANNTGSPAIVYHSDPNAAQIDTWTQWNIDLKEFQTKGINLADVNSIAIGLGTRNGTQAGGSGLMYFDDIRLYRSRCVPDKVTLSQSDLNSDCVVDLRDLQVMAGDWLTSDLGADLNSDSTVDFKDYAVLADEWLEEQPSWPVL